MRVLIQRVSKASVEVDQQIVSEIGRGLLVLAGIETHDSPEDLVWLSRKICSLRIFDDEAGTMNRSVSDIDGDILAVSQFTLHARVKKGNRPSYTDAARPEISVPLYEQFVSQLEQDLGKKVGSGLFGAHMNVSLVNDGPVTIFIDSKDKR